MKDDDFNIEIDYIDTKIGQMGIPFWVLHYLIQVVLENRIREELINLPKEVLGGYNLTAKERNIMLNKALINYDIEW